VDKDRERALRTALVTAGVAVIVWTIGRYLGRAKAVGEPAHLPIGRLHDVLARAEEITKDRAFISKVLGGNP
jgi:hypothetical protein